MNEQVSTKAPERWWEEFFEGLSVQLWLEAVPAEHTEREAARLSAALALPAGAEILDVPCGGGRLSLALAARGYRVTGVDSSREFLAHAAAAPDSHAVAWEHRDMRDLPWPEAFDAAFCFWGSFGYFDDAGNAAFARAVWQTLLPGGRFLVDTRVAETVLPDWREREWDRWGEVLVLEERRYDHAAGRVEGHWTFIHGGRVETHDSSIRVYTYSELCQVLQQAGFAHCEGYGSLNLEPFALGAPRLLLVATK
jgi:SAM-dependent methyltransferase